MDEVQIEKNRRVFLPRFTTHEDESGGVLQKPSPCGGSEPVAAGDHERPADGREGAERGRFAVAKRFKASGGRFERESTGGQVRPWSLVSEANSPPRKVSPERSER